jgi:predicted murein hydrolase (TIGR00659 family)
MNDVSDVWVYLSTTPLLHLTLTLAAFATGTAIYERAGRNPVLNPVLIAVALLVGFLTFTGTSYGRYFEGAQFVHFLLGPATVCLALPLYRQFDKVRKSALALSASILCGSLTASASAVGVAWLAGGDGATLLSLAPKSVTAPVAMGIAEQLGGIPALTAALVIVTGIIGATLGPVVLTLIGVTDWAARGVAMGTGSHGIGTARALQVNEVAGAFSGLAMGLNALATAVLLPVVFALLDR